MRRVLSFLIAGLIVLMAARVQAASPPLELSVVPAGRAGSSAADNLLQANLMGVIRGVLHRLPVAPASFRLTLGEATVPITLPNFMVGQGALRSLAIDTSQGWQTRPSFELREQWDFLRRQAAGPSPFERLVRMFDVEETDRPWLTTTLVRLLAGRGALIPYAALEREIDVDEDFERYGLVPGRCSCWGNTPRSARNSCTWAGPHAIPSTTISAARPASSPTCRLNSEPATGGPRAAGVQMTKIISGYSCAYPAPCIYPSLTILGKQC